MVEGRGGMEEYISRLTLKSPPKESRPFSSPQEPNLSRLGSAYFQGLGKMVNVKNPRFQWFNLLLYNTFLYRSREELGLDLNLPKSMSR